MLPRPIDTITILGMGKSVYDYISLVHKHFADDFGEIWTINSGARIFGHDVLWDMHTPEWLHSRTPDVNRARALNRRTWLKDHKKPIYMPKADPEYPTSITFPLRTVIEKTNSCNFSNGAAYPLAMAYCCDVKRLRLFGCDFAVSPTQAEPGAQCCAYWVGRLVEKGVKVELTNNTMFLDMQTRTKGEIYGYHDPVIFEYPEAGGVGCFIGPDYADQ